MLISGSLRRLFAQQARGARFALRTKKGVSNMTRTLALRFSPAGAIALLVLSLAVLAVSPAVRAGASTDHCPDHEGNPGKVEVGDNFGSSLTLPAGTVFCVKAGTGASGIVVSDGSTWTVDWLNDGGQTPAISYYIIYDEGSGGGEDGPDLD